MRCSKCGSDNREGRKFCATCGAPLVVTCPKCGVTNQPSESFCGECGAALGDAVPAATVHTAPIVASADGERRHLTVLFCDLVGSTEIAARLDPEEWREVVAAYHRAAAEAITRYGGHVAKYLGDGVMAFFGYPEAHDNDAERAARAGLAMLDAIAKLGSQAGRPKLAARVGIDSGAVVVGAGAGKEADVFGEAPNIAARVQAAAEPGTVLITDAVYQLISGLFVVESRGAEALKGIERPLQLYKLVEPSGVRGRLEAAAAVRGLTPFVGREDELRLLMTRWERSREGEGQVALIIGEAGIGKSRLLQRFHELIPDAPHAWLEAAAAPFFQNTPFYSVAELLHQLVGQASLPVDDARAARASAQSVVAQNAAPSPSPLPSVTLTSPLPQQSGRGTDRSGRGADLEDQLVQLESALVLAGLKPAEAIPLIAPLLNLPASAKYPPPAIPPEQQRRRLLAMLMEWMLGAARAQPLTIVLEDLHWADASTLEVMQLLAEQGATAPLLLLCTARPEFHPQWPLRAHHTQITLNRLSAGNVREMIAQVAARNALAGETVDTVIERTGGVPLFVEELTRTVLESGSAKLAGREIPVTLHDSLMARLDRLGPAKEVIQIGAVIGSEFSYELLHAVHPVGSEELQSALRSATDAELVYVRGIAPEATYQFKHALIRDAAYEALLKSRRKELHRLVASTIDEKYPDLKEAHPEVLARHWTEAGETELAIAKWSQAGKTAETRNAFREALENYRQALTLLSLMPQSPERDSDELEHRLSAVRMLWMTSGHSAGETNDEIERAVALAERSGNLAQLIYLMAARVLFAYNSSDFSIARLFADQALELALREGTATSLAIAYTLQIQTRFSNGDLAGAEQHFTASLKFVEDTGFRQIPGGVVAAFGYASWNAWLRGRVGLALERNGQMVAAVARTNTANVAWSNIFAAQLYLYMREYERAEALAGIALELSEKNQIAQIAGFSRCVLGQARAELGSATAGIGLIRQGIVLLRETGARLRMGSYTASLARAQATDGYLADALATVQQALQMNPDELAYRPEILRICGELRLKQGQIELAESDFHESIALARNMGAKAWELRSTMSLARLLASKGRRDEAHMMLADIYNWFTEGFDTADLKEAKALLDELAS